MIHYHGSPLGGHGDAACRFYSRRHAFVSFARPDHIQHVAEFCQSFALDNGAFSAWTRGEDVDMGAYRGFVSEWSRHPGYDWCVIPDAIESTARDNDRLIEQWGDDGVPVWHLHEPVERLFELARNFPRVALGSSGEYSQPGAPAWWHRMGEAMDAVCVDGSPTTKLHGLRMLDPEIFARLPFASADSTNAVRNAASGSRFSSYRPIAQWQRASVIADRIESFNSSSLWTGNTQHALAI